MQDQSAKHNDQQILDLYWDAFFRDDFKTAYNLADQLPSTDVRFKRELQSKAVLRQGKFLQARDLIKDQQTSFRYFVEFLITANPTELLKLNSKNDFETKLYQVQCFYLCTIFWGEEFLKELGLMIDANLLLEESFSHYISLNQIDRAILASLQSFEIVLEEKLLSHDLHLPVIEQQLDDLLQLADQAKYLSTKAKIFLVKAKLTKNRECAQDAEILFGKENNINGLGEVYFVYAKDFREEKYYEKALENFTKCENLIACGFIYESIASRHLHHGLINEATKAFSKSKNYLLYCGAFETNGLLLQEISLKAISGKYQKVKEAVHELIKPQVPSFFIAQAYQILASTLIQLQEKPSIAQGYAETSINIFKELKRYNQLVYAQNLLFQILMLNDDDEAAQKIGEEIIHLASRLGNDELKANKYLDLAFLTLKRQIKTGEAEEEKIAVANELFKKAINIFQSQDNFIGEADSYQAMGNLYASLGRLEEALEAFNKARNLYKSEEAYLQNAITEMLIGVLLLNYVILNEQTYLITMKHFDHALLYFAKENLLDLNWKATYYLADLNHKYYFLMKDKNNSEIYKNKAKKYYLDMYIALEELADQTASIFNTNEDNLGISPESAFNKAYQFFLVIGEESTAIKFKKHLN